MNISFTVPGKPFGKQRPRVTVRGGYAHAYTPNETIEYEEKVKEAFKSSLDEFSQVSDGYLGVSITAYYGIPKATSKVKREKMLRNLILPDKKPDADNIAKVILDPLDEFWKDDSQVVHLSVDKRYSNVPRVDVHIYDYEVVPFDPLMDWNSEL